MNLDLPLYFFGQQAAEAAPPAGGGMMQLIIMGLLFAGMWFLMIAPQRKKQKAHEEMLKALGKGDDVITTGGVFGTITNVKKDRFVVKIAENTKVEVLKSAVQTRVDGVLESA
tara:strand:- start:29714 stop:30052 length:339 start_codon:yes stop_codon:yes gene_type:complete